VWVQDTVSRLSSWVSPLGWPEVKVTVFLWPRSRHRMVTCTCQAAYKTWSEHENTSVAQVQLIVITMHRRITEEQGGSKKLVSCKCIGVARGGQKGHGPPKFLENIVILCFERRFSKQNRVIRIIWNILAPQFPPKIFGLATPLCRCTYGHVAESSSNYRKSQRYPTLRGAVQSVCIRVYLESGQPLCDAAGYLEILWTPCYSEMREWHRCCC